MTSTPTIEVLWHVLRKSSQESAQRRIDAEHPFDIYVDFKPPDRPGLVAVCANRPAAVRPLRAVTVDEGRRGDGRWLLRLSLDQPHLFPVFAALCKDIIDFTRTGVSSTQLASAVIGRLDHWRTLLERDNASLGEAELRGLIGELSVLETVLERLPTADAVASWTGPLGTPQDFTLPDGSRIEVKAARRDARTVRINGLGQLTAGDDPLELAVVRLEDTGVDAPGALTAPILVERIAIRLAPDPKAAESFAVSLALAGWHEHARHHELVVRLLAIERHTVGPGFPRLTSANVPTGVQDADYTILLPQAGTAPAGAS